MRDLHPGIKGWNYMHLVRMRLTWSRTCTPRPTVKASFDFPTFRREVRATTQHTQVTTRQTQRNLYIDGAIRPHFGQEELSRKPSRAAVSAAPLPLLPAPEGNPPCCGNGTPLWGWHGRRTGRIRPLPGKRPCLRKIPLWAPPTSCADGR